MNWQTRPHYNDVKYCGLKVKKFLFGPIMNVNLNNDRCLGNLYLRRNRTILFMRYLKKLLGAALFLTFIALLIAAIFYLFIYPFLIASKTLEPSTSATIFGIFLFLQLLLLTIEFIYISFANTYNLKRKTFLLLTLVYWKRKGSEIFEKSVNGSRLFITMVFSYFLIVYIFAIAYLFLGNFSEGSFKEKITLIDTLYLSFTAISVGPAGVEPASILAKLMVMLEILIGLTYTILLFSVTSSFLMNKRKSEEAK